MKKKLLVPLDGSELAEIAIPWATYLARAQDWELEFLRAFEPPKNIFLLTEFLKPESEDDVTATIQQKLSQYLKEKSEQVSGLTVTTTCMQGDAASVILKESSVDNVGGIVIASHGRGGVGRWLMGSVATKVIRGCHVPVLVVKAGDRPTGEEPVVKKILVPLDGSKLAETALSKAADLARKLGAALHLFQGISFAPLGHPQLDSAVRIEVQKGKEYLDSLTERYPDLTISTESEITGLSNGILEQAGKCDLVVMSSHGRTGLKRWILGSVAEEILEDTERPVLVVRP